jgi:hypothetical protein
MDHSLQSELRLALHAFLDLCREARGWDLSLDAQHWLSRAELYGWECLAKYREIDPSQQTRLLGNCVELETKVRHLASIHLPKEPRAAA